MSTFGLTPPIVLRSSPKRRGSTSRSRTIQAMIAVQAIDWVGTMVYLLAGMVTLSQVATASFLPIVFIAGLVAGYPRAADRPQTAGFAS